MKLVGTLKNCWNLLERVGSYFLNSPNSVGTKIRSNSLFERSNKNQYFIYQAINL